MERLGGFEARPRLAVGVSGGADSLGLALLAQRWAAARGGALLALIVDHGLRAESAAEAARVGGWLQARGIPHAILRWEGEKPATGIQAAARAARHRLLAERCRDEGILHLALAHHRDDQAETVLLRFARGSGIDGLAGMAPVRAAGAVRVIRPLLDLPRDRLAATCRAFGQDWIEDPSNRNPLFARARLRAAGEALAAEGLDPLRLADVARRAARARNALESATAALLAEAAEIHPEGWLRLDPKPLLEAPEEIALRALVRCIAATGGAPYPPKDEAAERLYGEIGGGMFQGRTLGGCRILPRRGRLVIAREPVGVTERLSLTPGGEVWWDRRFAVRLAAGQGGAVTVAKLGRDGWRTALAAGPDSGRIGLPEPVRETLPALWDGNGLAAVPHLGFSRPGFTLSAVALHAPEAVLCGPAFPVVSDRVGII
ncbi:tRNA lysidine(34) synthetase TilS [Roseomonas genomospecies 6]|uniref:tRNA(Ile)-lysidine synthase n=2 Tax=Roseomonas genomospecies 6 TaxID=214106 RepID=A0A9W7NH47_9PROT|nr:tRNA lysidine(34) synthetase TilS [Roseomonas genomospecies 6]